MKIKRLCRGLYGLGAFGGHGQRKDPQPSITLENCPSFIKTPLKHGLVVNKPLFLSELCQTHRKKPCPFL